jgi:hypothetical protein
MNPLGLFSQVLAVAMAISIGYFYVQPTIDEIGTVQDDIATYAAERVKIESINSQLAVQLAAFESISRADKVRLATYMPRTMDDIAIMRDVSFIVEQAGVTNTELSYDGLKQSEKAVFSQTSSQSDFGDQPATAHSFKVGIQGTYTEIKAFLQLVEQNEYPLEVHELSITTDETELLSANMQLVTYVDELVLVSNN